MGYILEIPVKLGLKVSRKGSEDQLPLEDYKFVGKSCPLSPW